MERKCFKDIEIGGRFIDEHLQRTREIDIKMYGVNRYNEYKKIDKSTAKVIRSVGWGNDRQLGGCHKYAWSKILFVFGNTF